jgi:hypothetical protein
MTNAVVFASNALGEIDAMDRLRLNHVPQNTPATSANRLIVTS